MVERKQLAAAVLGAVQQALSLSVTLVATAHNGLVWSPTFFTHGCLLTAANLFLLA